jgi:hypothetical protein
MLADLTFCWVLAVQVDEAPKGSHADVPPPPPPAVEESVKPKVLDDGVPPPPPPPPAVPARF